MSRKSRFGQPPLGFSDCPAAELLIDSNPTQKSPAIRSALDPVISHGDVISCLQRRIAIVVPTDPNIASVTLVVTRYGQTLLTFISYRPNTLIVEETFTVTTILLDHSKKCCYPGGAKLDKPRECF